MTVRVPAQGFTAMRATSIVSMTLALSVLSGLGARAETARSASATLATGASAAAMYNLGILYINGQGVKQDFGTAGRWFEKSAAGGDVDAMLNLGSLYYNGQGVKQDYAAAAAWF